MIDLIKKHYRNNYDDYRADVLESRDARMRVLDDIQVIIDSVTKEDIHENILNYMFSPMGTFTYLQALPLYVASGFLNQRRILIDDLGLENDEELWLDIASRVKGHIEAIDAMELPQDLRESLSKNQLQALKFNERLERGETITIGKGSAMPREELHEWIRKKQQGISTKQLEMVETLNSPLINAIHDAINTPKSQLKNPDQVSIWDDDLQVATWGESTSGSKDARIIKVKTHSQTRKEMTPQFAVEDFHVLLKGNEQASKFLWFWAESFREEIDIKEFADRIGQRSDSAMRYIRAGRKVLEAVKLEGSNGGYIQIIPTFLIGKEYFPLLDEWKGKRGKITIKSSDEIDLTLGGYFNKLLPVHAYQFNKHAWLLTVEVYTRFRVKAKDINPDKDEYILSVPLLDIISALRLPHPDETERITQFIVEPISEAIKEFNQGEADHGGSMELSLALDYSKSESARVKDGELIATLRKGDFFNILVDIHNKQVEHLEAKQAKQERKENRVLDAKGRQLARLEHEDKKKSKGGT